MKILIDEGEREEELREALHVKETRGKQFHELCIHACVCIKTKVGFHYSFTGWRETEETEVEPNYNVRVIHA